MRAVHQGNNRRFVERVFVGTAVATVAVGLFLLLEHLAAVLLLVFASILLAIFLRTLAEALRHFTSLPIGWSLLAISVGLAAMAVVIVWRYGPLIANAFYELWRHLPDSLHRLRATVGSYPWGTAVLDTIERSSKSTFDPAQLSRIAGVFSTALGALGSIVIVIVLGLYFSTEPEIYLEGSLHLVPPAHRQKARQVAQDLGRTLRWWLAGRITAMVLVGLLVWLGLLAIGLPFAFILGVLAGMLSFVPNVGPTIAAVPGILVGFSQSNTMAAYVAVVYLVVLTLEGYFLTPFIQRQAVFLPEALSLIAQLIMGLTFGILGLILASPLTVVIMTLVQIFYVRDVLEEPVKLPGDASEHT